MELALMKQGIPWREVMGMDVQSVIEYSNLIAWERQEEIEQRDLEEKEAWLHRDQAG